MRLRGAIAGVALLALLGSGASGVEAHPATPPRDEVVTVPPAPASAAEWIADPAPSLAVPVAALAGLVLAGGLVGRSRRLTTLAFLALFAVFAAESSLHAVHHLDHPSSAVQCHVLGVSQHLTGASCDISLPVGIDDAGATVVAPAGSRLAEPGVRPDQGRAPPVLPA